MKTRTTLQYILIASIILIFVALTTWYFFIRAKQQAIEAGDTARGAGLPSQSFAGGLGSTYENIVSSISSAFIQQNGETRDVPQLTQITKTPVAGAAFVGSASSTRLRFVERGTGFVFDVTPTTLALKRLTNTLVPVTYEALITNNDRFILRGTDESGNIATFTANLTGTSTEDLYSLVLTRLPNGLLSVTANTAGDALFYIAKSEEGGVGIRSSWDGSDQKQLFSSALSGWNARWLPNDHIIVAQNPSGHVAGFAYDAANDGLFSPLVRNVVGLTALPHPSSSALLYGSSANNLSLFARISADASDTLLPIRTTADKCVWSTREQGVAFCAVPQNQLSVDFLDERNRGEVHSRDAWWRVDARSAEAELLLTSGNSVFDVENPTIDQTGTYIEFTNAIDKSLWLLRIPYE